MCLSAETSEAEEGWVAGGGEWDGEDEGVETEALEVDEEGRVVDDE